MFRVASIACALSLISSLVLADEDVKGKSLMLSAAVLLSDLSTHRGKLEIDSPNKAFFSDGSAFFRKLSACRYSQYSPASGPPDWFEILDFSALSGSYRISSTFGVQAIILDGTSPHTRCFLYSGQSGCADSVKITAGSQEQERIITDLRYMLQSCPEPEKDPY